MRLKTIHQSVFLLGLLGLGCGHLPAPQQAPLLGIKPGKLVVTKASQAGQHASMKSADATVSSAKARIRSLRKSEGLQQEQHLVQRLEQAYRTNDHIGFLIHKNEYLKVFPHGVSMDRVLYFSGVLSLNSGAYGSALQSLNTVIQKYPPSSLVLPAKRIKASVYQRMNLPNLQSEILQELAKLDPGNVKSAQALRNLRVTAPSDQRKWE